MDYLVYDVFTETPFAGNPLAVFPDAVGIPDDLLQKIAREINYSETTFVFPPDDPAHLARVRIFTPTQEIPFAGHPTIGTAIALAERGAGNGRHLLELGVGPIPCEVTGRSARFETRRPLETWEGPPVAVVAAACGLGEAQVRTDRHAPVIASVGLPFAVAELSDRAALAAARPVAAAFEAFAPLWPTTSHFDLMVYVREGNTIRARVFAPLDGVPEDPATGSAAAALTALLAHLDGVPHSFEIAQGVEMGRPSRISTAITVENGAHVGVSVAGSAVPVFAGRLAL